MNDIQRRPRLPSTTRKVGYVDGIAAPFHGAAAQIDHGAERGGIVDVHVRWLALVQAFDQAVILDVVHPAVTRALCLFGQLAPERMLEFGEQRRGFLPLMLAPAPLDVNAVRVTLENALRALDDIDPAVRP